jgi:zinc transport system substrate-binding protein
MKISTTVGLLSAALLLSVATPAFAVPKVVASIKPVHSLVASVMGDLGTPELIVKGGASPHTYALKPSEAGALEAADIVFWTGHGMEVFLQDSLTTLAANATKVELAETPGLVTYPIREGGAFEAHEHEEHEEGEHAEGGHDEHEAEGEQAHEHEGEEHEGEEHAEHEEEHHHDEGAFDMHFWLDPVNAEVMLTAIAETLSTADPENAATYAANADAEIAELKALTEELSAELAPVADKPFVVFHDAYQYFEARFGLTIAGSITVNPEVAPGAQRIDELKARVAELGATCVFAEPQFEPAVINSIIEGTSAKSGVLDPEASLIPEGPDLYPTLLRTIAASLKDCLSQ